MSTDAARAESRRTPGLLYDDALTVVESAPLDAAPHDRLLMAPQQAPLRVSGKPFSPEWREDDAMPPG